MKKSLLTALITTLIVIAATFASYAACANWYQTADGIWHVYGANGDTLHDCWFCDDIDDTSCNTWYLIDNYGNMISGALIQDGSGNYYSLETSHNGIYGSMRYKSGIYDGINITFNNSHDGSFGKIIDPAAIEQLKTKFGLKQVSFNSNKTVYASSIQGAALPSQVISTQGSEPSALSDVPAVTVGPGSPGHKEQFVFDGQTYVVDYSWGEHCLTGYSGGGTTASGTPVTPHRTASGPSALRGNVIYVKGVSGPAGVNISAYDGIYKFEDTGGPAVETGIPSTYNKPVVDLYQATMEEALAVSAHGWIMAEIFILKPKK